MSTRTPWTPADVATLRRLYPDAPTADVARALGASINRVYSKAHQLGLRKSDAFHASDLSTRIKRGRTDPRMLATQFRKGAPSWNKGTRYTPGGRSVETQFKPGCRSVRWDAEAYGIGALRITTDRKDGPGTLQIRIGPGPRDWAEMSRYSWWSATGHWPSSDEVVCRRNGDNYDTRFANLELVTRAELAERNRIWTNYPPEIARIIQLKGAIRRQVNRLSRQQGETP